jgi:hypothetical protein
MYSNQQIERLLLGRRAIFPNACSKRLKGPTHLRSMLKLN